MNAEVLVPEVGESITEGTIAEWKIESGDYVSAGDEIFELETDKITMPVTSEHAGKIEILVKAGETVSVGQVVARIDTEAQPERKAAGEEEKPEAEAEATEQAETEPAGETVAEEGPPINPKAGFPQLREKLGDQVELDDLAPSVRRLVEEHRLSPGKITGSGRGGRLTKADVLKYLENREKETGAQEGPLPPEPPVTESPAREGETATTEPGKRQTRKPMSRLRARIAERLVQAQQTTAMLTTFNEADMTAIIETRSRFKDAYREKYGVKLGFMSFFIKASVDALKTVPRVNVQIDGDQIVENHFYDIGVAVSTDKGLVVPVIRDPDRKSFAEIERDIAGLAEKAHNRTLTLDDLSGGVFTITNGGIFGSMLSTPILNPPQSGILGMHRIKKRPVVVGDDERIVARPMMYLALSYDHRLVDGAEAVVFLRRIVECIENPERMMLGI